MDEPLLPIAELDRRAWSNLTWRQDHLALRRLRSKQSWHGLWSVEYRAVRRLSARLELDDDQRRSLLRHHMSAVEQRMAAARPDLAPVRLTSSQAVGWLYNDSRRWRWRRRSRLLREVMGWGTWCGNRRVDIRNQWFWFTTWPHYRQAPQL